MTSEPDGTLAFKKEKTRDGKLTKKKIARPLPIFFFDDAFLALFTLPFADV